MKSVLLATISLAALAVCGAAQAADMPVRAAPAPMRAPVFNWGGLYIGGHFGQQWSHHETNVFNDLGVLIDTTTLDSEGTFGGGQIGYNWMVMPSWLLGVEADLSGASITGDKSGCSTTGCASSHLRTDELATVRGRLGYVWNNDWLFYGTGGWAFSHSSTDRTITCVVAGGGICPGGPSPSPLTGMVATASGSRGGWAAGGGIERALVLGPPLSSYLPGHLTAKVEYMHTNFDNIVRDLSFPGFPKAFRHDVTNSSADQIRFGLNYLF